MILRNGCNLIFPTADQSIQSAETTVGIIRASLKEFKDRHPGITKIKIRMDNAANYKSLQTIQALCSLQNEIEGLRIEGLYFCEPGKL